VIGQATDVERDRYRWLVGKAKPTQLHLGRRGTPWTPSRECTGGIGGESDGGYRTACGEWGLLGEDLLGRVPVCAECRAIAAREGELLAAAPA